MAPTARPMAAKMPANLPTSKGVGGALAGRFDLAADACGAGSQLAFDRAGLARGELLQLLGHHARQLLVGRPEGLAQADRMIDDPGDGGIPVVALAVVEHAVAADHQLVGVAGGEGGGDGLLVAAAHAIAIDEAQPRQAGERGMLGGIIHGHREFAGAAVKVERADLEHRRALVRIEILEGDEIVGQRHEVAAVARQAFECQHRVTHGGRVGLGGLPVGVGRELVFQRLPVGGRSAFRARRAAASRPCRATWRSRRPRPD